MGGRPPLPANRHQAAMMQTRIHMAAQPLHGETRLLVEEHRTRKLVLVVEGQPGDRLQAKDRRELLPHEIRGGAGGRETVFTHGTSPLRWPRRQGLATGWGAPRWPPPR